MKIYTSTIYSGNNLGFLKASLQEWRKQPCNNSDALSSVIATATLISEVERKMLPPESLPMTDFVVAIDDKGNLLSVAAIRSKLWNEKECTEIVCLVTRPDLRDQGMATAVLAEAARAYPESNQGLYLQSLEPTIPFFQKLSFQQGTSSCAMEMYLDSSRFSSLARKKTTNVPENLVTRAWRTILGEQRRTPSPAIETHRKTPPVNGK
jgi:N-acetylglutamate synthase-like GNAT family acetyltransferase